MTFFENHAVYEIMWKNMVQSERPQMAIRYMHFLCWMTKVTYTNFFLFHGTI